LTQIAVFKEITLKFLGKKMRRRKMCDFIIDDMLVRIYKMRRLSCIFI